MWQAKILYLQPWLCFRQVLSWIVIRSEKDSTGEKGFQLSYMKAQVFPIHIYVNEPVHVQKNQSCQISTPCGLLLK